MWVITNAHNGDYVGSFEKAQITEDQAIAIITTMANLTGKLYDVLDGEKLKARP